MVNDKDVQKQSLDDEDDDESDDEDYVPTNEEGDVDIDSGAAESDGSDDEGALGGKKRRKKQSDVEDVKRVAVPVLTQEEEKAKSDALWALMNASSEKPQVSSLSNTTAPTTKALSAIKKEEVKSDATLTRDVKVDPVETEEQTSGKVLFRPMSALSGLAALRQQATGSAPKPRPTTSGLSGLVANLGKKNQPSTLLKSKADWETFKNSEGLSEELKEHTKSKDSYVERQAFLQRADVRQFEQEKTVRDRNRTKQQLNK